MTDPAALDVRVEHREGTENVMSSSAPVALVGRG